MNKYLEVSETAQKRMAEIRSRVAKAQENVLRNVTMDGNRLVISLEFEDAGKLANAYLEAIADCNSLLYILDGGTPV